MISQEALRLPPEGHSVPQSSLDLNSMEDYWSELRSIEETSHSCQEELLEARSIDEAELEEAWLQEAGLSTLVSGAPGDAPAEALLSTLTRTQAALVKKRLDNYTQTMRKRNKQPIRHVRDVFATPDSPPVCPSDPVSAVTPSTQPSSKLPHWTPSQVESCGSDCQPVRETLCFDVPYSEGAVARRKNRDCQDCQRVQRDDGALPIFLPPCPKLGLTRVEDLSLEDMKKIGYISLIELTTYYDALGVELKRTRSTRGKARESGIFGVPLATLLENDQKKLPGSKVPLVFTKLLSKLEQTGLQTEGILRVPGSASRVKHLRQELEAKFYEDRFDWEQVRQNDAAGLLKMFIRELPCPLLTLQHLPAFLAVQNMTSSRNQIQALHLLIMLLPEPNRDTLKALLEFLRKVVAHEDKNRMSLWNVSMIVAPNLFIAHGKSTKLEEMQGAAGAAHLVRLLITNQDLLWTVPCFLISHLRKLNEVSVTKKPPSSEKSKRKLLRRWTMDRDKREKAQFSDLLREGIIRVHAPMHTKVSMAILLDSGTRAKDVMARFDCENGRSSRGPSRKQRQHLFEVGGNIGERCLDPEAHLLDLYRVNPNCSWVFKPRTT
ncbi:rho GTPase-activating protein 28-like isoform X1 [Megalops cyprinoides]|uniref:rho GTPase-activating protein 28-like isoform X1 n=1 Tax=Megalops cyprinoides TaxID=118141 RepID=UPI00186511F0|nr:rho GTPase-activating protein 28-like isoform X1 [Megalops cyprinoides]XP_036375028.1 rho GTPase-activating protein 28-like isoform X1 [Megalops cyprinoides]XP_036375029.1 rho GTPase-activating protein 28-like isoform X1 [Megalops cyprinoides]XP_036375030.1 rho GTPase-activating protein 28-like isoform X1 [Megalops cyprinoides]